MASFSVDNIRLCGYTEIMQNTSLLFKALSEEIRLRIIALLGEGELCVCELIAALDLPQSTISRHLSYLKNAGWIEGERRGVWMYYRLAAMKEGLQDEIRRVLIKRLPRTAQGTADISRLSKHVREKGRDACNGG